MSNRVILRPASTSSSINRRQPLLRQSQTMGKAGTRLGEAVGGTAAVCCCCPCAVANIVYLAVLKVPARLCMKALKKSKQRRRRRVQSSEDVMFQAKRRCSCGCCDDLGFRVCDDDFVGGVSSKSWSLGEEEEEGDKDVMELEKEMWDRFYSSGFWRSSSKRDSSTESSFSSERVLMAIASAPNLRVLDVSFDDDDVPSTL